MTDAISWSAAVAVERSVVTVIGTDATARSDPGHSQFSERDVHDIDRAAVAAATTSDLGGLGALRVVSRLVITIRSTTTGILAAGILAVGIIAVAD